LGHRVQIVQLPPIGMRSIVISVSFCLSVCVFVRHHIFGNTCPIFTSCFVHVTCGRGSVLLWWRSDTLCTSGFMDDVIFAHKPRLLDVAAQLKHSHMQPWVWLKTVRSTTSCRPTDAWDYFSGAQSNFPLGNTGGGVRGL